MSTVPAPRWLRLPPSWWLREPAASSVDGYRARAALAPRAPGNPFFAAMPAFLTVRRYCAAVCVAAFVVVVVTSGGPDLGYVATHPVAFGFLTAGVLLGEMLPVRIPRGENDELMTLSTCFSVALLLIGGLAPAVLAQGLASVVQDLSTRRPGWRIRFNVGQYTLSLAAALFVMRLLSVAPHVGSSHPFTSAQLPAVLLGSATFFLVNTGVVGVAVALYQGVSIRRYLQKDAWFVVITGGVLLFLAPIVIAANAYSVFLLPMFLAPMLGIYVAGREAARTEYAARHDGLTGLTNRSAFHQAVTASIQDNPRPACVLLMDLDRFKEVNDTLGHRHGDLLLGEVAERLKANVRSEDRIARLGGDEFAIFSYGVGQEAAVELAQRVADALRAPFELEQIMVDTQASVGIALFPDHGADVEVLLQKADVAMYQAKTSHVDMALYEESHDHHSPAKLALTADLRSALESEEIVVWYQPVLDLKSGHVSAVEALVRWQHPDLGLLSPAAFIDMAERTNLIKPLTHRVLAIALRQIAEWRALDLDLTVAVNLSARVLIDHDLSKHIHAALQQAAVPPSRLKLEVTESALMTDPVAARDILKELDRLGIEISIDDFGTGYSSLAYLAKLPVSEVKIDRSFVSGMAAGSSEAIIVESTIDLAHHLGLRAIAEGVEDLALIAQLQTLGCDAIQGFGISRPLPPTEATGWLLRSQQTLLIDQPSRSPA
jgi:diguanylate cyclase (GGDEF)-like protein